MTEFKQYDVVTYSDGQGVAIVDSVEGMRINLTAWRTHNNGWMVGVGHLWASADVKHHPEPDRIWAEFAAWQLAGN